jgi:hypothetical protein
MGPRKVSSERERRSVLAMAGDDPGDEPGWEVTKNMVAFRHSYANTGSGFTITTLDGDDNRGVSIFDSHFYRYGLGNGRWMDLIAPFASIRNLDTGVVGQQRLG